MKSIPRTLKPPKSSLLLLGIRGVGKSTWAKNSFPDAYRFNLLDEKLYQDLLVDPALFGKQLKRLSKGTWVIVDEIQRLPWLLNEVHIGIEDLNLKFALLGSSARKLRKAGVNLLGGRAVQRFLHPFTPFELGSRFSMEQALRYGTIPVVLNAESERDQLAGYVQLYLRQEIQAEALVRNLPGFARFLPVAALFHGQVINANGLGRDAGLGRTTVQGYLSILEDTLVAFQLPAFEGRLRVKEKSSPKLYFCDPGLVRAAKRQLGEVAIEERGSLFEGFFIQLVRSCRDYGLIDYDDMYYWAVGKSGPEVDLIIRRGKKFTAIEFKATKRLRKEYFNGLRAMAELDGIERRILVYEGERAFIDDSGTDVIPVEEFLVQLERGKI